jgi:hypothetical protein
LCFGVFSFLFDWPKLVSVETNNVSPAIRVNSIEVFIDDLNKKCLTWGEAFLRYLFYNSWQL